MTPKGTTSQGIVRELLKEEQRKRKRKQKEIDQTGNALSEKSVEIILMNTRCSRTY